MSSSSIVITFTAYNDLVHAKHASTPANFSGLIAPIREALAKELGPDAGNNLVFTSLTVS